MKVEESYKGIPDKVKIGQREYKVVVRNKQSDAQLLSSYGYTIYDSSHIILRDCMSIGLCRSTLLHEVMHAIIHDRENRYTDEVYNHKKEINMEDMGHYFISVFEESMVLMMINNKKLVRFLSDNIK